MILDAHDRLKANPELQVWWQSILDDPRFSEILDAGKVLLEQQPPSIPQTTSVTETFALAHSASLGARAALGALSLLGSRAIGELRAGKERARNAKSINRPAAAGTGYGVLAASNNG